MQKAKRSKMQPSEPLPVKLICGVLYSNEGLVQQAAERMTTRFGNIDFKSPIFAFDTTDYYEAEMGTSICRQFWTFLKLINPKELAPIKIACNEIEMELARGGNRTVNLDPGYMDYDKFVLASAKYNAHKIYLDSGIYADLTLRYEKGRYKPSDYAFPDFKSGQYDETFLHIRARFKGQLRKILKNALGEST